MLSYHIKYITFAIITISLFNSGVVFGAGLQNYNLGSSGATNYEVGEAVWNGNVFQVQTRAGGTGTIRSMQLTTGSNVGLVINSSGNIGIGTTAPSTSLEISKDVANYVTIRDTGEDTGYETQLAFMTGSGFSSLSYVAGISANITQGTPSVLKGDLIFSTNSGDSATEKVRITSGGNVGIGTNTPATTLHVQNSGGGQVFRVTNTSGSFAFGVDGLGGYAQASGGGGGMWFYNSAGNSYMGVTGGGNIGIATTTPSYKLDVVGTSQFSQPVIVGSPTAASHAATKSYVDSSVTGGVSGSTNYIPRFTSANAIGNSVVTQQTTGGTGITVGSYLSAGYSGSNYGSVGYGIAYTATSSFWNYRNSDTASKLDFASGGFQFETAPSGTAGNQITFTRVMTILQGGNIGIGTTGPDTKLTVAGQIKSMGDGSNNLATIQLVDTQGGGGTFQLMSGYAGANKFSIYSNTLGTHALTITSGGIVGIGTTTPSRGKLEIVGGNIIVSRPSNKVDNPGLSELNAFEVNNAFVAGQSGYVKFYYPTYNNFLIAADYDGNIGGAQPNIQFGRVNNPYLTIINNGSYLGNIGVATTTPTYKFTVEGTSQFSQPVIVGTPTANTHATTKSYVDSMFTGSGQWTTSGSNIYSSLAGNVGVGTNTPSQKLHVSTTASSTDFKGIIVENLAGGNSDASRAGIAFKAYDWVQSAIWHGRNITGANGGALVFGTNPNTTDLTVGGVVGRMVITNEGNVGIGTTAPEAKLDINQTVSAGSAALRLRNGNNSTGTNGNQIVFNYDQSISWGHAIKSRHNSGAITGNAIDFYTWQYGVDAAGTIGTQHGMTITNGNVGIGTTSPNAKLAVGTSATTQAGVTSAIINNGLELAGSYPLLDFKVTSGSLWRFQSSQTNNDFYLQESTTPRITLQSGGNIGIATTTPSYKLDVVGTSQFSQPVIVGTPTQNSHAATKNYVDSLVPAGGAGWTDAGANVYLTTVGDNVGIGTTGPVQKLDVAGVIRSSDSNIGTLNLGANTVGGNIAGQIKATYSPSYGYTGKLSFNVLTNGVGTDYGPTEEMYLEVVSADTKVGKMVILPWGGNVGIGTTNPVSALHVVGAAQVGTYAGSDLAAGGLSLANHQVFIGSTASRAERAMIFASSGGTRRGTVSSEWLTTNLRIELGDGSNVRLGVDSSGNIGIATTTPSYKLDVVGTSQFSQPVIVGTPTATTHATTKSYVDSMFSGSGQWTTSGSNIYSSLAGNVGIGSTSPTNKFVVDVTNAVTSNVNYAVYGKIAGAPAFTVAGGNFNSISTGSGTGGSSSFGVMGSATGAAASNVGGSFVASGGTSYNTQLLVGTATAPNDSYGIYSAGSAKSYFNGSVGIGTTAPSVKLDVVGGASSYGANIYGNWTPDGSSLVKNWLLNDGSSNWTLGSATIQTVADGKIGNKVIRSATGAESDITSTGWIPIDPTKTYKISLWARSAGTVSPDCTYFSGRQADGTLSYPWGNGGWGQPYFVSCATIPTSWTYYERTIGPNGTSNFQSAAQYFQVGALLNYAPAENGYVEVQGFRFEELPKGLDTITTSLRVTGSGPHYITDGNIGIATTTPSYKLDFVGTSQFSQPVIVGTPTANTHATTKSYVDSMFTGSGQWTTSGTNIYSSLAGNVGIGTNSPAFKFDVRAGAVNIENTGTSDWIQFREGGVYRGYIGYGDDGALFTGASTDSFNIRAEGDLHLGGTGNNLTMTIKGGNVGIGTTTPGARLEVKGNGTGKILIGDIGGYANYAGISLNGSAAAGAYNFLSRASDGTLLINRPTNGDIAFYENNGVAQMIIKATSGNVGIATSTPLYTLSVNGTGSFNQPIFVGTPTNASHAATKSYVDSIVGGGAGTGSFSTLTVSGTSTLNGNIWFGGAAYSSLNMNGNNITGINKITASVIDPIYSINGVKYATYGSDTIGIKTEIFGKESLTQIALGKWQAVIDFGNLQKGSDLWLFWQAINEGKNMKDMVIALTPEFDGRVWYELHPNEKQIVIYGQMTGVKSQNPIVSYHIAAPRHDAKEWGNVVKDQTEKASFILQSK